ncbi:hypothetical protein [Micromonospora polyrhachis]|uniref:Uncharacterized protein n=1 Tax=Micromonospora polyrhachis TaxID=1282883 RepID=A0A7W7SLY3_9ACTN|nr:hypothetical protein [Micromonospora polyrhachis]MBB4957081.1 hypothetical protein [Micromonospora polyrhachis]
MTTQGTTPPAPPTPADSRPAPPPRRDTCRLISDYAAIAAEHVRDVAWLIHATHGDQPTGRDAANALRDAAHALDRAQNIYRTRYRKFDLFVVVGIGVAPSPVPSTSPALYPLPSASSPASWPSPASTSWSATAPRSAGLGFPHPPAYPTRTALSTTSSSTPHAKPWSHTYWSTNSSPS